MVTDEDAALQALAYPLGVKQRKKTTETPAKFIKRCADETTTPVLLPFAQGCKLPQTTKAATTTALHERIKAGSVART